MRIGIITLYSLIFMGCSSNSNNIEEVEVMYVEKGTTHMNIVSCLTVEAEFSKFLERKTIRDSKFLSEMGNLINKFEPIKDKEPGDVDIRVKFLIKREDSVTDTLCMGQSFFIVYNGQRMEEKKGLFELIDKYLY